MMRRLDVASLSLALIFAVVSPRPAPAADTPPAAAASVVDSVAVSDRELGPFPFLPSLDGFDPVPAAGSTWNRDNDFSRYHFQPAPEQTVEVGGRLLMRHFGALAPGSQSLEKIVESYRMLVEEKGGAMLYSGRFFGGAIDTAARSEQQAREGATYLVRTPERGDLDAGVGAR